MKCQACDSSRVSPLLFGDGVLPKFYRKCLDCNSLLSMEGKFLKIKVLRGGKDAGNRTDER